MQVRKVEFDFEGLSPHWCENREFAQLYNAASTQPVGVEPYLCKVMGKVKDALPAHHQKLHDDIAIFIKQEVLHCKQHIAFNKMLGQHYPAIKPLEKKYAEDYEVFLKKKSLRFNVAYSEGFESMSAIPATTFFEDFDEYWRQSDPRAEAIWKWHLAEEYEHREVMHNAYKTLYGNGPFAYLYRLYGFVYSTVHILRYVNSVAKVLLEADRAGMMPEERAASIAREKQIKKIATKQALSHLRRIFSPFYDPSKRPPPRGVMAILEMNRTTAPITGALSNASAS